MSTNIGQKINRDSGEDPKKIPVHSRVILEQAKTTIQHLIDAAVELITNSDDSYKQLGQKIDRDGEITVYVKRARGGMCKEFWIEDCAEGMKKEDLEKAIEYGAKTSGFHKGRSARGLFGRGLKEAVLSLGEGEIFTVRDGMLNIAKLWWDEEKEEALYRLIDNLNSPHLEQVDEDVTEFVKRKRNGTLIKIKVKNERMIIPEYEKFKSQLADHYALRDINSSKGRKTILIFDDEGRKKIRYQSKIEFAWPKGELIVKDYVLTLPHYSDQIRLNIWESPFPLNSQPIRYDPYAKAGILIKTRGAILDNQLFKHDSDPASFYFWGEALCDGIAEKIRNGEKGIIDPNRGGIKWGHDYCQCIKAGIEKILTPLIQKKKRELEKGESKEVSSHTKNTLKSISQSLDRLAREEMKEWEGVMPKGAQQELTIVPKYIYVEPKEIRALSIYAPNGLIQNAGNKVSIISNNANIPILFPGSKRLGLYWTINLDRHPQNPNVWYKFFKVTGREIGEKATISCKLSDQEVKAIVEIVKQRMTREIPKEKKRKKGGVISNIVPNQISNPIQRVEYVEKSGEIKIYVRFPGVERYLTPSFKEIESREDSRAMFAELIGEAFCKTLAVKKLQTGAIPTYNDPERDISAFNSEINNIQKKYLYKIHEIILHRKFRERTRRIN